MHVWWDWTVTVIKQSANWCLSVNFVSHITWVLWPHAELHISSWTANKSRVNTKLCVKFSRDLWHDLAHVWQGSSELCEVRQVPCILQEQQNISGRWQEVRMIFRELSHWKHGNGWVTCKGIVGDQRRELVSGLVHHTEQLRQSPCLIWIWPHSWKMCAQASDLQTEGVPDDPTFTLRVSTGDKNWIHTSFVTSS